MVRDAWANLIAGAGLVLIAAAGFAVHLAVGLATAGLACCALAVGIIRARPRGEESDR